MSADGHQDTEKEPTLMGLQNKPRSAADDAGWCPRMSAQPPGHRAGRGRSGRSAASLNRKDLT